MEIYVILGDEYEQVSPKSEKETIYVYNSVTIFQAAVKHSDSSSLPVRISFVGKRLLQTKELSG